MTMPLHLTKARYLEGFQIEIAFSDGRKGIVDLFSVLRGSLFSSLKNPKKFAQFKIHPELQTLSWKCGADLAPEYIYFLAFKKAPELQNLFKKWGYIF